MLNYRRHGSGERLVLQHGFLGGSGYWLPQITALSAGFDVIAADLPGFAGSAGEPVPDSMEGFANALVEAMDRLEVDRFSLIGHSLGGMIALQLALDFPGRIDKLVLYGTAASGELPGRFETFEESIVRLEADGVAASARRISATWFVEGEAAPCYELCLQAGRGATVEACQKTLGAVLRWDVRPRLGELRVPTLIICGDSDRSTKPETAHELWEGIVNSNLCVIPGCAHNVHLERSDLFNQIVKDFLHAPK